MDSATFLIVAKSIGALAFILVGFFALKYGVQLFREGTGLKESNTQVELPGGYKVVISSVGGLVLLSSMVGDIWDI